MVCLNDISGDLAGLQGTLQQVYNALIVHCSELIGVSTAVAGFGTLWYVADHVYVDIMEARAVNLRPLFRPFVIGLCIFLWPSLITLINGVMEPTVIGTAAIVNDSNQAVATLLQQKEQALEQSADWQMYVGPAGSGDLQKWEALSGQADDGVFSGLSNRVKFEMARISYNMKNSVKLWLSEILQVLFEAAALCINTVRTFFLVILAILGPLAFGLSVFKGLEGNIANWFSKYINVFLWLPVANIFGSLIGQIQQEMIKLDIAQLNASGQTTFGPTDTAYLVFLVMAIVGYFSVPSITNYIVRVGAGSARPWIYKSL
jgi:conjugative transposon TraJ protein